MAAFVCHTGLTIQDVETRVDRETTSKVFSLANSSKLAEIGEDSVVETILLFLADKLCALRHNYLYNRSQQKAMARAVKKKLEKCPVMHPWSVNCWVRELLRLSNVCLGIVFNAAETKELVGQEASGNVVPIKQAGGQVGTKAAIDQAATG